MWDLPGPGHEPVSPALEGGLSTTERVENLKSKVGGTKPAGGDFGEFLNSTANASSTTMEPLPEETQESL
uniref:Uncharacterized protein n=1 Tax=Phocoena sinus TaxID=42100 RepID=A0A8C9CBA4_PHOSS